MSGTIQLTLDNGSSIPCFPIIHGISVSCIPNAPLSADTYIATLAASTLKSIEGMTNNRVSWQFITGTSTSSGGASLRHLGEFNDNVTNGSVVILHVDNGGKQYQLEVDGSPTDWQYPIFYPVQVPHSCRTFKTIRLSPSTIVRIVRVRLSQELKHQELA